MKLSRAEEIELIKSTIKIDEWLESFGIVPERESAGKKWYKSPIRNDDNNPSFMVDLEKNRWKDFGSGKGGSIIDLAMLFLNLDYAEVMKGLRATLYKKKV